MDGARFANVVAAMDKKPQELTWEAGVDVMSFGTTKNGTMSAEAVIFFNTNLSNQTNLYMKRSGHLLSKMRFISSQIIGYLKNDLWIELAKSANKKAEEQEKSQEPESSQNEGFEGNYLVHPKAFQEKLDELDIENASVRNLCYALLRKIFRY